MFITYYSHFSYDSQKTDWLLMNGLEKPLKFWYAEAGLRKRVLLFSHLKLQTLRNRRNK